MLCEAYELFGCNTADLFVISVNDGESNAACIAFDQTYGIEFPCISGIEGGGTAINNTYGIGAYPTYILIAPNHDIVEQDMWPIQNVGTFINYFQSNGLQQAPCGEILTAAFTSDVTEICEFDVVNFTDASIGTITSWNWTFEGGNPASSTEQNPSVTYNDQGTFNVELTVSDGTNTNTLLMEDYLSVIMSPPIMLLPFSDVCVGWPAFELTGGTPAGGVYSGTGVSNGWFDPAVAGLGSHVITYTYTASNGCDNAVQQSILVDPCTGTNELQNESFSIYPNPTMGNFELKIFETGNIVLSISNMLGQEVYSFEANASGFLTQTISLENHEGGIYFVKVQSETQTYMKKLRLLD
jgi:PKD repeat protein